MGDIASEELGWRLRLRAEDGSVLGAGILLSPELALTSAHLLPHPGAELSVDYVDQPEIAYSQARALAGRVIPRQDDPPDGDVALLAIDPPRYGVRPAPLRRIARYLGRPVRMGGFTETRNYGLWVRARIEGPYGSWMQLTPQDPAYVIEPGFSGTGVANARLDEVSAEPPEEILGMVVSRFYDVPHKPTEFEQRHGYMISMNRIAELLPEVARLVDGEPVHDSSLISQRSALPEDAALAERLAGWFAGARRPAVELLTAAEGSGRAQALARALPRADEALDAEGRSASELAARLLGRLRLPAPYDIAVGGWLRSGGPRPTLADSAEELSLQFSIAVGAADKALDPPELIALLVRLRTLGCRLLIVFEQDEGPGRAEAEQLLLAPALRELAHELKAELIERESGRPARERVALQRITELALIPREPDPAVRLHRLDALVEALRTDLEAL